jgi:hypothetical protein
MDNPFIERFNGRLREGPGPRWRSGGPYSERTAKAPGKFWWILGPLRMIEPWSASRVGTQAAGYGRRLGGIVAQEPAGSRRRYEQRAKEVLASTFKELKDFRALLEAERRGDLACHSMGFTEQGLSDVAILPVHRIG